jgi:ABC-type multidrug transport system fused ATPase/permease subunit
MVFRSGRIVEAGTYDDLLKRGGFFAELAQAQFVPVL